MKLLTFFVACLCQLGGTEIRCEEETGSQNAGFVTRVQIAVAKSFKCDQTKSGYHLRISNIFQCNLKETQLRVVS